MRAAIRVPDLADETGLRPPTCQRACRLGDLPYWADPFHTRAQQLNHMNGGRGLYWDSPDGHVLEVLTRP